MTTATAITTTTVSTQLVLTKAECFDRNYDETLEYLKKHGTLKGICRRLRDWFNRQGSRRDISNEEKSRMEHLKKHIVKKDNWEIMFEKYANYRKETGRLVVPKTDKVLSQWVADQRRRFKDGILAKPKQDRLMEVGFVVKKNKPYKKSRYTNKQEEYWDHMFRKLCQFKTECGHCNIKSTDDRRALANWVSYQRKQQNKEKLDIARKEKLDAIGFAWKAK